MTHPYGHPGGSSDGRSTTENTQHQCLNVYRNMQYLRYPPGPRLPPISLSPDGEHDQHQRPIAGEDQLLPTALLFQHDALPKIDSRLAFQERTRAVAQPTITFMPEFPEYLWGAVSSHVTSGDDGRRVHFEEIAEPATNPPVSRMRISTALGGWLVVEAQREAQYVAVVDVQKAVIRYMKEVRQRASSSAVTADLSRWVRITDWDGTEVEVEVWVWKGLQSTGTTLENWDLKL